MSTGASVAAFVAQSAWFKLGALCGALAVVTGAFGAHGLKSRVDDLKLLKTWDTAAHYQLVHSFLFLIIPLAPRPSLSGWLLLAGVVLFSGSLYALVLSRIKVLGAITPIGGLLMIAAWLSLLL